MQLPRTFSELHVGQVVLWIVGIACLGAALWLSLTHNLAEATFIGLLGLLVLAFARLTQFKKVKGLGFEAELWDQTQKEAELLIAQMRDLIFILAETTGRSIARAGRWDSHFTRKEQIEFLDSLRASLGSIGVSAEKAETIYREFKRITAQRMAYKIWEGLKVEFDAAHQIAQQALTAKHPSPIADAGQYHIDISAHQSKFQMPFDINDLPHDELEKWPALIRAALKAR